MSQISEQKNSPLLAGLRVVLVRTRFPENIGMAARACANMGCPAIDLVDPERWDFAKASPLATPKGLPLLETISVYERLEDALASSQAIFGTTARKGGWRNHCLDPRLAAERICERLACGESVSLLFGPEDRGLENSSTALCHDLITIPTAGASSLNLAQAVLLVLYECARAMRAQIYPESRAEERTISFAEQQRFLDHFKHALLDLDCLHGDNADYFFLPWHHLFSRIHITRKEYDALMGLCRQIHRLCHRKDTTSV